MEIIAVGMITLVREILAIYQLRQTGQSTDADALKAFRAALGAAIDAADAQIDAELAKRKEAKPR